MFVGWKGEMGTEMTDWGWLAEGTYMVKLNGTRRRPRLILHVFWNIVLDPDIVVQLILEKSGFCKVETAVF